MVLTISDHLDSHTTTENHSHQPQTGKLPRAKTNSAATSLIEHMLVFCANLDTLKMEAMPGHFARGIPNAAAPAPAATRRAGTSL